MIRGGADAFVTEQLLDIIAARFPEARQAVVDGGGHWVHVEYPDDVVLEGSTLAKPIRGKQQVATVLATASSIYESLEFTAEAQSASTTYLQWRATAFGGIDSEHLLEAAS